jgi:hypothetical protein
MKIAIAIVVVLYVIASVGILSRAGRGKKGK